MDMFALLFNAGRGDGLRWQWPPWTEWNWAVCRTCEGSDCLAKGRCLLTACLERLLSISPAT